MRIAPAAAADAAPARAAFAAAFADDPLMDFFFGDHPDGRDAAVERFFGLLLRARIATGMPALLARDGDRLLGGVMGYATVLPDWPEALNHEWEQLEAGAPALRERFAEYERIADAAAPPEAHYYLGVIGVVPAARGSGAGGALLRAFCALAAEDPRSGGVFLETANPRNLGFYAHHGFEQRGSAPLGTGTLWCLFHPHPRHT